MLPSPDYERICEFNGQSVWIDGRTHNPRSYHDCGYTECDLLTPNINRLHEQPLELDREDWAAVSEYYDEYGIEE